MSNTTTETQAEATIQETGNHSTMKPFQVCDLFNDELIPHAEKLEFAWNAVLEVKDFENLREGLFRITMEASDAIREVYRKINASYELDRKLNQGPPVGLADLPWVQSKEAVTMPEEQEEG